MEASVLGELARRCGQMKDGREENRRHPLANVVTMAVVAVLCGADGWSAVANFCRIEARWFGLFLPLKHGVPSRQTFERVFALLQPQQLERCLKEWFELMSRQSGGSVKHISIDGKALRRSFKKVWDRSSMAYLVSAFATENGLVMAQTESSHGRGGELGAIKRLLNMLDLKGRMVTIDAGGCQRAVAAMICEQGGDYCLAVKDNQRTLHGAIRIEMHQVRRKDPTAAKAQSHQSINTSHGRKETRTVWVTQEIHRLGEVAKQWKGLAAVAVVESCREIKGKEPTWNWRYYMLSRVPTAVELQSLIRSHWGIENGLHYVLDVTYGEDGSRIRKASATQFSRLRRLTLNMLRTEKSHTGSLASKRQCCGWSREYRVKVLAASLGRAV